MLVTCWCKKHQVNPENKDRVLDGVPFCKDCANLHEALVEDRNLRRVPHFDEQDPF